MTGETTLDYDQRGGNSKLESRNPKQIRMAERLGPPLPHLLIRFPTFEPSSLFRVSCFGFRILFAGFTPEKAKAPRPGWAHGAKN
jgi:hypothetical protein